jgi:hypothetical protein
MTTSPEALCIIERVRLFLKWHADRFDNLDEVHVVMEQPLGWRRGEEFWLRPDSWLNDIFDGDAGDSEHAARVLREVGLLRDQPPSLQITAKVRGVVKRVYAIDRAIFDWKPEVTRRGNKRNNLAGALLSVENETPLINPTNSSDPTNLAAILEQATRLGLAKALEILALAPSPDDRHYGTTMRSQTALINTMVTAQLRADEVKFRAAREDNLAEFLKVCSACAKATLGYSMTEEEIKLVLDGGYEKVGKPAPPGVIERLEALRRGEKPPKSARASGPIFDYDQPFDA